VVEAARANTGHFRVWGALTAFGLAVAALACIADQTTKFWLLYAYDLADRGRVAVASSFNLVVVWNTGISYGLFQQPGWFGVWALLAFKVAAVVLLWLWLARTSARLTACALGLIIGGALGNAADRLHWPGVMDFVDLHVGQLHWYVFNVADAAIVAGVIGLIYQSLRVGTPQNRPDRG
jgi:signal peptidase II